LFGKGGTTVVVEFEAGKRRLQNDIEIKRAASPIHESLKEYSDE